MVNEARFQILMPKQYQNKSFARPSWSNTFDLLAVMVRANVWYTDRVNMTVLIAD